MDALDLAVEDGVRVYRLAGGRFEPIGKLHFGLALGLAEGVMQAPVVGQRLELAQLAEVGHPAVADGAGDRASERRVRQPQPAARRDAVGLVVETLGEHLGQILDRRGAQQFGVNGRHAVGAVRADNGQVGHADLALGTLLDEAYALDAAGVAGETLPHRLEQAAVDLQLISRCRGSSARTTPAAISPGLRACVVRIRQRPLGEVPGLVPAQVRVVEQDAHQLGHRQRRMRIIELDGDFLRQHAPVGVAAPEAPHQIGQRTGDEKILLHRAQSLAHAGGVVGYRTRVTDSAVSVSARASTKSPLLNS